MGVFFRDTASEYLTSGASVTALPFTMTCWFYCYQPNPADDFYLMDLHNSGNSRFRDCYSLVLGADFPGPGIDKLKASTGENASDFFPSASSSRDWRDYVWQHACGVWVSDTDRRVFLDGWDKVTDTTAPASPPSGINTLTIGRQTSTGSGNYMWGVIAEAAIWNVALEDAEVRKLADGAPPNYIRRESLKNYWPLSSYGNWGYDVRQANHLTKTGTRPGLHPPMKFPKRKIYIFVSAPAAGLDSSFYVPSLAQMENSGFVGRRYV